MTRNDQQKQKILSPDFAGWILDPVLTKLTGPQADPTFVDPRNCLTFWARPPLHLRKLITRIQQELQTVAPGLWLMPIPNLHMTAMEATHSLTAHEIEDIVTALRPSCQEIADLPSAPGHAARVIKPMVSYDSAALALSFVPAAGEALPPLRTATEDAFTYHHLRRSLYSLINKSVPVDSRYVVPSAHLTVARFNTPNPFVPTPDDSLTSTNESGGPLDSVAGIDISKREALICKIEEINELLQREYWPQPQGGSDAHQTIPKGGEWIVGEEKGLDFRKGRLWYGGGETVYLGKGI